MALTSMTGFARVDATHNGLAIQVEARCVNGRSSDIKLRLPSGLDHLDKPVRSLFQTVVRRGNASITISLQRETKRLPRINTETLNALRDTLSEQATLFGEEPPKLVDLLPLPGVVEMVDLSVDALADDEARQAQDDAIVACAGRCADQLGAARRAEGAVLRTVLEGLVGDIAAQTEALAQLPEAQGAHVFGRLKNQLDRLLEDGADLDSQRLHQEAAVLASKADIEEELARLRAHCNAARDLFVAADPVGRKLDFLAQEFNREANTVCSKASALAITQKGLALKALIDQFKEQVQNIE